MIEVSRRYIDGYDDAMRSAIESVQRELGAALSLVDYSKQAAEVRVEVSALMDVYCEAAAEVGARISSEFYNGLRRAVMGSAQMTSLQTGRSREATEKAIRAFMKKLLDGDQEDFEELLMERVELEAKRAAAYNTIDNVRNDPDEPRFARVPQGDRTCDFCLMLASRGPVYLTEESAGAFTKYHAHCDCKVVPFWGTVRDGESRRTSLMAVEGYDPDLLYAAWKGKQRFTIPDAKISKYCLKEENKARAFEKYLGFERNRDEDRLTLRLYAAASTAELRYKGSDQYGDRYFQMADIEGNGGRTATVCIAWIDRRDGGKMQLTSAYVKTG